MAAGPSKLTTASSPRASSPATRARTTPVEVAPPPPWNPTNAPSADELVPIVYDQLRALAGGYLKREKIDVSLEPGMLVNETYLRLRQSPEHAWVDEKHFLAVAAIAMRRVLVDHARKRRALKRGYGHARVGMENVAGADDTRTVGITEIDEALRKLEKEHARQAKVVELRFFAGLNHEQIATVLGVSRKTVVADWGRARDWLAHELATS